MYSVRTRCSKQLRKSGWFMGKCGCTAHEDNNSLLCKIKLGRSVDRGLSNSSIQQMITKSLLSKRSTYLCKQCVCLHGKSDKFVRHVRIKNADEEEEDDKDDVDDDDDDDDDEDDDKELDEVEMETGEQSTSDDNDADVNEPESLGEDVIKHFSALCVLMKKDVGDLYKSGDYKDIQKLLEYDPKTWLEQRPSELVELLKNLCGLDDDKPSSINKVAQIIEIMYGAMNKKLVLPGSFRHNLTAYSFSHSRLLIDYLNSIMPASSYTTLTNWISQQASDEIEFPKGDVRVVFDNEQVVGKRYKVNAKSNIVPVSVITSHANLILDPTGYLQENEEIKPKNWLFQEGSDGLNADYLDVENDYFRTTRNRFLSCRLRLVANDQKNENGVLSDFIDVASNMFKNESRKLCSTCDEFIDNVPCQNCGKSRTKTIKKGSYFNSLPPEVSKSDKCDPYSHFAIFDTSNDVKVTVGEPDMLNPNSYTNISEILRNIGKRAGVENYEPGGKKKWLFLENDATIYRIVSNLIKNVLKCFRCNNSFFGKSEFEDHNCFVLYDASYSYKFDWIVQQFGILHLEINCGRAFMALNWPVFMEDVARMLNFTSDPALQFIKAGSDHHKMWTILEVCFLAFTDELLIPYIRRCFSLGTTTSVDGFWKFVNRVEDPNYTYAVEMVLTYLFAFMQLRKGSRSGDPKAIRSAVLKIVSLFFGTNHPIYQELLLNDLLVHHRAPATTRTCMGKTYTMSRTGREGHYQSGDAELEEINKSGKKWTVGVPSDLQWRKVFRNLDKLENVRNKALKDAGFSDPSHCSEERASIVNEVNGIRILLRSHNYFSNPLIDKEHISIDGNQKMSNNLASFSSLARENFNKYVKKQLHGEEEIEICPVFATEAVELEYAKIENKTVKQIEKISFSYLRMMNNDDQLELCEYFRKNVKNKTKAKHIDFYHLVMDMYESKYYYDEENIEIADNVEI